jgi:peptidoglycan/xylan/chitin deacetylase (PgdA/CDA1 family)
MNDQRPDRSNMLRRVRASAAPFAKSVLFHAGGYAAIRRVLPSRQLAILRYHAVCEPDAGYADPGICVSPAAFERHVAYLAANYRVLPLPEAVATLVSGKTLPRNAVAITFDDGYADNLAAARTLARFGASATFYITAGCLADGQPFWPAELRALIAAITASQLDIESDGSRLTIPLASARDRTAAVSRLTKIIKAHSIPRREALREQLRAQASKPVASSPMLRWDEVVTMHELGMVIGSHTMTHPNLPNAGADAARQEIVDSKALLERHIGAPVTMFSYPNGGAERYMTPAIARIVREAGFAAATTSRNAFASAASDPYALERVQVSEPLEELIFALEIERFAFKPAPRPAELE